MVEIGEIWSIGEHIIACGDINQGHALKLLEQAGPPDMSYVDPPWLPGVYSKYHNDINIKPKRNFDAFLIKLVQVFKEETETDVFIEIGRKYFDSLKLLLRKEGATFMNDYDITYQKTRPCKLIRATWGDMWKPIETLRGLDDSVTPEKAILAITKPGEYIFDPCVGTGLTPITAHLNDRLSISMDINPHKVEIVLNRLKKHGAGEPKRIGSLDQ